jgi:hypothetical protein
MLCDQKGSQRLLCNPNKVPGLVTTVPSISLSPLSQTSVPNARTFDGMQLLHGMHEPVVTPALAAASSGLQNGPKRLLANLKALR